MQVHLCETAFCIIGEGLELAADWSLIIGAIL